MSAYTFITTIPEDRHLLLPEDIPAGPAEIRITFQTTPETKEYSLTEFLNELVTTPGLNRSKEELDQELQHERDSWE